MGVREGEKLTTDREAASQPRDWTASSSLGALSLQATPPQPRGLPAEAPVVKQRQAAPAMPVHTPVHRNHVLLHVVTPAGCGSRLLLC